MKLRLPPIILLFLISFWLTYFLVFIISYTSFGATSPVESYSELVKGGNSIDNPFYKLRYFLSAASIAPLLIVRPRLIKSPCNIFFLSACFLGLLLFANTQSLLLGLSAPAATISAISLAYSLQYIQGCKVNIIPPFVFLFALPSIYALTLGLYEFLYNSYYGRGRLLLGFVHPKEAAGCLFFVYVLILINLETIASLTSVTMRRTHGLLSLFFPFIFLVIGSRTTALLAFGYSSALFIPKIKPLIFRNLFLILLLPIISIAFIIVSSIPGFYIYFNDLSSNRFELWGSYLDGSIALGKSGSGFASALDNSYLNLLFDSSSMGLCFYLFFMLCTFIFLSRKDYVSTILPFNPRVSPSALLLFILLAGLTDSGLTSPTSINFISAWALLFAILISSESVRK
jgi:hypothetical protein